MGAYRNKTKSVLVRPLGRAGIFRVKIVHREQQDDMLIRTFYIDSAKEIF